MGLLWPHPCLWLLLCWWMVFCPSFLEVSLCSSAEKEPFFMGLIRNGCEGLLLLVCFVFFFYLKDLKPWKDLFILPSVDSEQALDRLEGVCQGTSSFPLGQEKLHRVPVPAQRRRAQQFSLAGSPRAAQGLGRCPQAGMRLSTVWGKLLRDIDGFLSCSYRFSRFRITLYMLPSWVRSAHHERVPQQRGCTKMKKEISVYVLSFMWRLDLSYLAF